MAKAIAALRTRDELAFLPAALEIVETPPSPLGRAIAFTIIAAFCVAAAWASFGSVDVVSDAPGRIIPSSRSKVIQPLELGVVTAIHVQDGQLVKAGDPLIDVDQTTARAERLHLRQDLDATQLDVARLRAALGSAADPLADFDPPDGADPVLVDAQRQFLISQVAEHRAKMAMLERQEAQKAAERDTIKATIDKTTATLDVLNQAEYIRKYTLDLGIGKKMDYLSIHEEVVSAQKEILVDQSRYVATDAELASIVANRAQTEAEYRRTLSGELTTAEAKAAGLAQDLVKAEDRLRHQELRAPIDGVVQQLAIHTIGGVITPAQPLMVLVPQDGKLEVEASIANRDIGFVQVGQPADIKVRSFDFTRYGLLHATVTDISRDSVTPDRQPSARTEGEPGGAPPPSLPPGDATYAAKLLLDRTTMDIDGRQVSLSAGMAVTAEIKTGSRRIITYLLSPLIKHGQESMHER